VRPPDPARLALAGELEQRGWLGIVDEDEVVVGVEARGVRARRRQVPRLVGVAELDRGALQAVVDRLRHLEERLVAADDAPVRDHALIIEQRHDRPQELRDTAAVGRCVQMQHAGAAQRPPGIGELVQQIVRGQAPVRRER
jgi:hypothetical protein